MQARTRLSGDPHAGAELTLGVEPPPGRGQHAAVVDAALGIEERTAVALDELIGDLTPLRRPLGIVGQLARVEHVAARVHDGVQVGGFTTQRRRHRLIEQREATSGIALADPDQAELRRGVELEVDVADVAGEVERPSCQHLGGIEVGHPVRLGDPQPGVGRPGPSRSEQPFGAGDPPVCRGKVGEVGLVDGRQPQRRLHRTIDVARLAKQGVRRGAVLHARPVVAEPPQGGRQAETGLCRLDVGDRPLERLAGVAPPTALQCLGAGLHVAGSALRRRRAHVKLSSTGLGEWAGKP